MERAMRKNLLKTTVAIAVVGAFVASLHGTLAQDTSTDGYYFWKLGHLDGPHDSSRALGISRDGKVAVGSTKVVDFYHAWRMDIDWVLSTETDGIPPLYNELQVQEDIGVIAPSQPSAAYAASDMLSTPVYDLSAGNYFDWGGSLPVGGAKIGKIPYAVEWIPEFISNEHGELVPTYLAAPDFGGGATAIMAYDVTSDGRFIVGTGANQRGEKGFIIDNTLPLDAEGKPIKFPVTVTDTVTAQSLQTSNLQAVSASSTLPLVVAGYGAAKTGNRAFVATNPTLDSSVPAVTFETTALLPMIAGGKYAEAYAMTPDGAIIAGRSDSPRGPQACIWFKDDTGLWVVKALGGLSKKTLNSVATSIAYRPGSPVGELIVVGYSATILSPSEAFVWTGNPVLLDDWIGYMFDLEYILIKTGAGEPSGMGSSWILNQATGVAFGVDGTRIVGWGTNPEGGEDAFLVTAFPFGELDLTYESVVIKDKKK
jgi:uncharacterized membrane protein